MNRIPDGSVVKYLPANAGDRESIPEQEDPLEEEMATFSSILARKSPWQKSLVDYSLQGGKESDTTEQLITQTNKTQKGWQKLFVVCKA